MRLTIMLALMGTLGAATRQEPKSAFETDSRGWEDLTPPKDLKGWKRVPQDPLAPKTVWSMSEDGNTLVCDGVGAKEMLLHETERGDGIFHVEWRFRKVDKTGYNSGVFVRSSLDGKVWVQAQVAHAEKPPVVGDLFAMAPIEGKVQRKDIIQKCGNRAKPPGEWNTYEIICKGKTISLWVNDTVTVTWDDCPVTKGHLGLQAEYFFIEFRNLKFKPLP